MDAVRDIPFGDRAVQRGRRGFAVGAQSGVVLLHRCLEGSTPVQIRELGRRLQLAGAVGGAGAVGAERHAAARSRASGTGGEGLWLGKGEAPAEPLVERSGVYEHARYACRRIYARRVP